MEKELFQKSFDEVAIILIRKPDKYLIYICLWGGNLRSIFLTNKDTEILHKILKKQIQDHNKSVTIIKQALTQR